MSQDLTQQFKTNSEPSHWLQWLAPILLSILAGWVTVSFAAGATTQRLTTIESQVSQQQETNKTFATREEEKIFKEGILRELNRIHDDVRAIRSNLEKR